MTERVEFRSSIARNGKAASNRSFRTFAGSFHRLSHDLLGVLRCTTFRPTVMAITAKDEILLCQE
jgi:hypothetical protein